MGEDRFETLFKLMDAADVASNEMLKSTTQESVDKLMAINRAIQNECNNQLNQNKEDEKRD